MKTESTGEDTPRSCVWLKLELRGQLTLWRWCSVGKEFTPENKGQIIMRKPLKGV